MTEVLSFGFHIIQRSNKHRIASWMLTLSFALNHLFRIIQNVHPTQARVLADYVKSIDMPFGELNLFFRDICLPVCITAIYLIVVFAVMLQFALNKKLSILEKLSGNRRARIGFVLNTNFDRFLIIFDLLLTFTLIAEPLNLNDSSILIHPSTISGFLFFILEYPLIVLAVYNVAFKYPIDNSVRILEGFASNRSVE